MDNYTNTQFDYFCYVTSQTISIIITEILIKGP